MWLQSDSFNVFPSQEVKWPLCHAYAELRAPQNDAPVFFPAVTLSESSNVIASCSDFTQLLICFSLYLVVVCGLFYFLVVFCCSF